MKGIKKFYFRQIALIVAFAVLLIGSVPAKSLAYVVGSEGEAVTVATRAADMATIQRVLESKVITERLTAMGLSMDEIKSRMEKLSDAEVHQFASQIDSLHPGGDGLGVIIALLIIAILIVVLLKLTDHRIIIK